MHTQRHGTAHATKEDEQDKLVDEFRYDLTGAPPGERSLIPQLLGWSYLVTAIALALVTLREAANAFALDWPLVRNGLGIALHAAIGIAIDQDKDWALGPALALSAATLYFTAPPALTGDPIAGLAALTHLVLLVALPLDHWMRKPPSRPA